MAQPVRTRQDRLVIRTRRFGLVLKVISRRRIEVSARTYRQGAVRSFAMGELTLTQLHRLLSEFDRQRAGKRIIWRYRTATRSATLLIMVQGWGPEGPFRIMVRERIRDGKKVDSGDLTPKQFAELIANLEVERVFATHETRVHM